MRGVALIALLAGCLHPSTRQCDDGRTCPDTLRCDEVNHLCVYPDQLTSCLNRADGEVCPIGEDPTAGVCRAQICITPSCGDTLVTGDEKCDGADDVPATGTCVDFSYDYGDLACTALCDEATDSCHNLGWHFVNTPGLGGVFGIWEDPPHVWVANQNGVIHYDGTAWSGPTVVTGTAWTVRGIWAASGKVFAVGFRGAAGVLAHYDGQSWQETAAATPMFAVWGRSPSDVFAVGDAGKIWHWNGSAWAMLTTPFTTNLRAVSGSPGRLLVAGEAGAAMMFDGSAWSSASTGSTDRLTGAYSKSDDEHYVVGKKADGSGIVGRLNSAGVFTMQTAMLVGLVAIHGRGESMLVTGDNGAVFLSDGSNFLRTDTPTPYTLQSVHVGERRAYAAYQATHFLEFDGAAWLQPFTSAYKGRVFNKLWGSAPLPVYAVGEGCTVYEWSSSGLTIPAWTAVSACNTCPAISFLNTVWGASYDDAWAGGPYGYLLHRDATGWSCVSPRPLGDVKWIFAIWGSRANDVFIGGGGDAAPVGLAHYNGSTWQDISDRVAPYLKTVRGIWGTSATNVFIVGDAGTVVHYDGTTFTAMPTGVTAQLNAVWGTSPSDVFAVGDAGTIVHFDGTSWQAMEVPLGITIPTDRPLTDVTGTTPDDVFAVGGRTLLHYNGKHWGPVNRPTNDDAHALLYLRGQLLVGSDLGLVTGLSGNLRP